MARPKGSKNRTTILREAQETMVARGLVGHEQDFLDSLAVMEEGMRHFYVRAIAAKQTKQPDKVIDAAMIQAGRRQRQHRLLVPARTPVRCRHPWCTEAPSPYRKTPDDGASRTFAKNVSVRPAPLARGLFVAT
jgi:hypothetical protein